MGERPRSVRAARLDRVLDRLVLRDVLPVEVVDLRPARAPAAEERPARALGDPLDERKVGRGVDDVVEAVVRAHPVAGQARTLLLAAGPVEQHVGQLGEPLVGGGELGEALLADPRRRELRHQRLELGPDEERLPQLLDRDHPHAHAAVRHERDVPGRGQPPQRLPHRGPAHLEPLRELLLPQHRPGRELTRDDRVLEREGDLVGLGAAFLLDQLRNWAASVEPSSASVELSPSVCMTASKYPAPASRWWRVAL